MIKVACLSLFLSLLVACSKSDNDMTSDGYTYIDGNGLGGKWVAVTHYGSNGSGLITMPLTSEYRFTVEFRNDSTMSHSANCPTHNFIFDSYNITTTSPPLTLRVNSSASSFSMNWYYSFEDNNPNELLLAPGAGIEPNYYRLKRIK